MEVFAEIQRSAAEVTHNTVSFNTTASGHSTYHLVSSKTIFEAKF